MTIRDFKASDYTSSSLLRHNEVESFYYLNRLTLDQYQAYSLLDTVTGYVCYDRLNYTADMIEQELTEFNVVLDAVKSKLSTVTTMGELLDVLNMLHSTTNRTQSKFIEAIYLKLTTLFTTIVRYVGNTDLNIDAIDEDYHDAVKVLNQHGTYSLVEQELNNLAASIANALVSNSSIFIKRYETTGISFELSYVTPIVFYQGAWTVNFRTPGLFQIHIGSFEFTKLSNIVNTTGLSIFKLYNKNPNRDNGTVTVYFNKQLNLFILLV